MAYVNLLHVHNQTVPLLSCTDCVDDHATAISTRSSTSTSSSVTKVTASRKEAKGIVVKDGQ